METATNCLPFLRKPATIINYDEVETTDTAHWNIFDERQKLKTDMGVNEVKKPVMEMNSMITTNTNNDDLPVNRAVKTVTQAEKSKLIGNINEDQIKKNEVLYSI